MLAEKIGSKIRHYRRLKEITQETMAKSLNMSISGYAKVERGETDISISKVEEIANVLNIPVQELLFEGEITNFNNNSISSAAFAGNNNGSVNIYDERKVEKLERQMEEILLRLDKIEKRNP